MEEGEEGGGECEGGRGRERGRVGQREERGDSHPEETRGKWRRGLAQRPIAFPQRPQQRGLRARHAEVQTAEEVGRQGWRVQRG